MQIKRIFFASLLCLIIVSCASQQATITSTPTNLPVPSVTSTLQPTNTPLPASIVEGAHRSGLSPEEIVSVYLEIRSYLENKDVNALANRIYFPLNECGRSKGDNIETKEEFTQRFNEVFTDKIISNYLNANLEDTGIDMYGIYIGGISFTSICADNTCNITKTWITGVNGYCSIRWTPPMENEQAATLSAMPDYSGENFVYGVYKIESYEDKGGFITEEELIERIKKIEVRIERDSYSTDSECNFGCSCPSPEYEFNKPFYAKYRALWYGLPAIGELIVICDGDPKVYFDILSDNKIGLNYFGYYVTLSYQ
jgi:hypothetical protein